MRPILRPPRRSNSLPSLDPWPSRPSPAYRALALWLVVALGGSGPFVGPLLGREAGRTGGQEEGRSEVESRDPRVDLEPCHVAGYEDRSLCGSLTVAEDPDEPAGRLLSLRVVVVPAKSPSPAPDPLFVLAGGPGQAASELVRLVPAMFEEIHAERDLVFVDQRGTGSSHPLDCELGEELELLAKVDLPLERLGACREALAARADLGLYTTFHAMPDLDRVRQALGYGTINLWGGSYGTRAALVYGSLYPEHTRALILDGTAPFELRLPLFYARDAQRALDLLFDACADDPACARAFPEPRAELDRVLATLREQPLGAAVRHPVTGEKVRAEIGPETVSGLLRGILYSTERASLIPLLVRELAEGNGEPLLATGLSITRGASESLSLGMMLSVLCAEDLPRISAQEGEAAAADTFLGQSALRSFRAACELWPRAELPDDFHLSRPSEVPTLLLSGEADPVVPPEWADVAAESLSRSRHLVVPGRGHNVSHAGCVPRLMAEFLDQVGATPDPFAELETECIESIRRPPFVTSLAGPEP